MSVEDDNDTDTEALKLASDLLNRDLYDAVDYFVKGDTNDKQMMFRNFRETNDKEEFSSNLEFNDFLKKNVNNKLMRGVKEPIRLTM